MKNFVITLILGAAVVFGASCSDEKKPAAPAAADVVTKVLLETTKGNVTLEVHSAWAPRGAERFLELVQAGYFDDCAFFRVIPGFMAQCGMHGDPAKTREWKDKTIPDDPMIPGISNRRGYATFALGGKNSRTTQFFINYGDNSRLDGNPGGNFSPFAFVAQGMDVVDKLNGKYGDGADMGGKGPLQSMIMSLGNAYLKHDFPDLDYIKKASIIR